MAEIDVDGMLADLKTQLEAHGDELQGLNLDDLRDAMLHPEAPASVMEIMGREAGSVQQGQPAPDFCLPRLHPGDDSPPVRLSDHFSGQHDSAGDRNRPVALIFGSYT